MAAGHKRRDMRHSGATNQRHQFSAGFVLCALRRAPYHVKNRRNTRDD